jgi:uncharacterized MAPEG superfamily protein
MESSPAFQAYALSSALVALQLILIAFWTGAVRTKSKQYVLAEDRVVIKGDRVEAEGEAVRRVKAAHQNALENAVPFFIVGALYIATGGTKLGAQAYCFTFLAMRIIHTLVYLAGLQPWRTISFGVGALCVVGMGVHVIRAVL